MNKYKVDIEEILNLGQTEQAMAVQNQIQILDSPDEEELDDNLSENTHLMSQVINTESEASSSEL